MYRVLERRGEVSRCGVTSDCVGGYKCIHKGDKDELTILQNDRYVLYTKMIWTPLRMFRFSILLLDYFSYALINKCLFFCQYITIVSGHNPLHFSIIVDTLNVRVERTMRQYLSTSEDTKSTSVRAINRSLPNLSVKSHFSPCLLVFVLYKHKLYAYSC